MKIVIVHNRYREPGGEEVVFESEKRLLESAGHQVIPFERSNFDLRDGSLVERISFAPRMIWSTSVRREFASVLESTQPDIVHVHNTFMTITPSIYSACSERGIPVVQTLHNFRLLCPSGSHFRNGAICTECTDRNLLQSVRYGCYRDSRSATTAVAAMLAFHRVADTYRKSVTRFVTPTRFAKEKFAAAGFPSEKFAVKPHFVDPDPGERNPRVGEYALYFGRLLENKGPRVLLNAWKLLPEQRPLQIIGDGPDRHSLESEARNSRLSGVIFRGQISRESLMEVVKAARFVVVPSTLYEGFGMSVVEAFACGVPVLCSGLGGLPELVQDGVTGLLLNPGDPADLAAKVEWAWSHPAELARMGRAARRKYETEYTPRANYSQLMEIYQHAMASVPSRAGRSTGLQSGADEK